MVYDCIIVGGGPAGAICSLILQLKGFQCVLFERRSEIDEKICGGFIPDRCREMLFKCGADLSEMRPEGNYIKGYVETRLGIEKPFLYKNDKHGYGVFRKNLDSFLLRKTQDAGTTVLYGKTVSEFEKQGDLFHIEGIESKYMVLATGAKLPVGMSCFDQDKIHKVAQKQSIGISEIITVVSCDLDSSCVYFWYEGMENDYFWAIPIGQNTWNIGYWSQNNRKNVKANFIRVKQRWIESNCKGISSLRSPKGALLGNADFSKCIEVGGFYCCGDFAGSNNLYTGEGIAQAVQSAQRTADIIIKQLNGGVS